MDTIHILINDYLDGELDDHGLERLADALRTNPAAADNLALNSFIHSQLLDWMSQRRVQEEALNQPRIGAGLVDRPHRYATTQSEADDGFSRLSDRSVSRSNTWVSSGTSGQIRRRLFTGAAAAVLVAATAGILGFLLVSRPVIVAQLTEAKGARWQGSQANLAVGTLLERGQQLHLVDGRALITFESGAKVVLQGPTTLRLDGSMAAHMDGGRVTATVPTQAIGFTITSPRARVIDLGTEFTLKLAAEDELEIHVFEGMVEIQFDDPARKSAKPLLIAESQSRVVRFTAQSAAPEDIPYDETQRISL